MSETQAQYEARCYTWGEGTYRPWRGANAGSPSPQAPAAPATGADWASWLDAPGGYRDWKADPANSGSNSPPPPRPKDKN